MHAPGIARRLLPITAFACLVACGADHTPAAPDALSLMKGAASPDEIAWSNWSAPVNLGSVINSTANDQHPSISQDGLSLYFVSDRAGGYGGLDIYVSQRASVDDPWGPPQNLGPTVNSDATDMAPDLTSDGHRLFLHSGRVGGCGDFDLYVSTREDVHDDFGWSAPVNLGCTINSSARDAGPTYTEEAGGPTLYFTSTRLGGPGDFDIYKSTMGRGGARPRAERTVSRYPNGHFADRARVVHLVRRHRAPQRSGRPGSVGLDPCLAR
jgi:hypothetical protein